MARARLERYELVSHLATGGMADVYRARAFGPHGFEKALAIKRILPRLARNEEFVARFVREAVLAGGLSHANVVQILDFGRNDDGLFIAMEFVDGVDLAALLGHRTDGIPLAIALNIGLEVCKGLDFAHEAGVIHRDVSPSNVLLSVAGEVKVADFGVAKAGGDELGSTGAGRIVGKWAYMSPEQTRGAELDARSDQFSLGVVLYEMFAGHCPTRGATTEEILRKIREEPFQPPSSHNPEVGPELDAIVLRCLRRDPAERYPSVGAVLDALAAVASERHIVLTPRDTAALVREVVALRGRGSPTLDETEDITAATGAGDRLPVRHSFTRGARDAQGFTVWQPASDALPGAARRSRWWSLAGIAAAGAAFGLWWLASRPDERAPAGDAGPTVVTAAPVADARPVAVDAGRAASDAAPAGSQLWVTSRPSGAEVWADGRVLGVTPYRGTVARRDSIRLTLKLAGHEPKTRDVALSSDAPTQVDVRLVPQVRFGTIAINATPWADVYLRGRKIATTPALRVRLPHGKHRLRLVNPELGVSRNVIVTVPNDSPYVFSLPKP